ncbi:replication initiation protein [Cysteiniphilum marinum]|uniref:replication initiation protein n=1 Tax=Cysteiniphilum marinum TaxID=2774191 RepID=UPI00193AD114|nr:replication initiation protein [Cysteiniphilum marinum]
MDLVKIMENQIDNYVVKANSLIEAKYRLPITEYKIVLILASLAKPNAEHFEEFTIKVNDLMSLLSISGKNYNHIKQVTRSLNGRVIEMIDRGKKSLIQAPWMSYAIYEDGGIVKLKLNDILKPFILQITGGYTKYRLGDAINMKSIYSARIYEYLIQYMKIGKKQITVKELRERLGIQKNELKTWSNFRKVVLDTAQKEINERSNIQYEMDFIKESRTIVAIEFVINVNKKKIKELSKATGKNAKDIEQDIINDRNPLEKLSEKIGDPLGDFVMGNLLGNNNSDNRVIDHIDDLSIALINAFSMSQDEVNELVRQHTKEKLWEKYHYYHYKKSTTEIKNPTAWFINAVIKDYSTADMKQATTIDVDWSDFDLETARLTDLKNELNLLSDILKEAQANLASPVCEYSSALREQYQTQIKDTNAKIADIQNEIKELEHAN